MLKIFGDDLASDAIRDDVISYFITNVMGCGEISRKNRSVCALFNNLIIVTQHRGRAWHLMIHGFFRLADSDPAVSLLGYGLTKY